jgi:hypothetical protein
MRALRLKWQSGIKTEMSALFPRMPKPVVGHDAIKLSSLHPVSLKSSLMLPPCLPLFIPSSRFQAGPFSKIVNIFLVFSTCTVHRNLFYITTLAIRRDLYK